MFRNLRLRTKLILSYFMVVLIALIVVGALALPFLLNSEAAKDKAQFQQREIRYATSLGKVINLITNKNITSTTYLSNPFREYFSGNSQPTTSYLYDTFNTVSNEYSLDLLLIHNCTVYVDTDTDNSLVNMSLAATLCIPVKDSKAGEVYRIKATKCTINSSYYCDNIVLPTNDQPATIIYQQITNSSPNLLGWSKATNKSVELTLGTIVPLIPDDNVFAQLLLILISAGVAALIVALIVSLILARSIAKPLVNMAGATAAVGRGDYTHKVPVQGGYELAHLAESFNQMANAVGEYQRMQRELIANVSHELKTPLTAIRGFSQAMIDGTLHRPEDFAMPAEIINRETERTIRLVNSLLELSKLESGTVRLNQESVNLTELLERTLMVFQPRAEESKVSLIGELLPTPTIVGDTDRLRQVFNNLVDNAFKYTLSGGTITVSCKVVDNEVVVNVSDTGAGIPPEDLPHIFERFYQADKSRSKPVSDNSSGLGLGLGLAICREIIHAHHGAISVQSKLNHGTTFTVALSIATEPTASADSSSHKTANVLKQVKKD